MTTKKNEHIETGALAKLESASRDLFLRITLLLTGFHLLQFIIRKLVHDAPTLGAFWFIPCYAALYLAVRSGASFKTSSAILLGALLSEGFIISINSGGLASSMTAFLILIPLLGGLLLGKKAAWTCLTLCSLLASWLLYTTLSNPNYKPTINNEPISQLCSIIFFMLLVQQIGTHYYIQLSSVVHTVWSEANIDHLTKLNNRRGIETALTKEVLRAKRNNTWISACVIDIDHFKRFNDINGHQKGDECIQRVAKQIDLSLRRPPDLSARLGGEEFLILLPETDPAGAQHVAENLRKNIEKQKIKYDPKGDEVITVSVGVCSLKEKTLTGADKMIEWADSALYEAKKNGRNQFVSAKPVADTDEITIQYSC